MNEDLDRKAAERAHENLTEFTRQNYEAAFKSGQLALRTVVLVNGGAAVAVLFFLSAIASKVSVAQISIVAASLIWFVAGITCGLIALTCAYLTNLYDANVGTSLSQTWEYPYNRPGRYTEYFVRRLPLRPYPCDHCRRGFAPPLHGGNVGRAACHHPAREVGRSLLPALLGSPGIAEAIEPRPATVPRPARGDGATQSGMRPPSTL